MTKETIAVAADHAGFELKEVLRAELEQAGYPVLDLGTGGLDSVDYPDLARAVAGALDDGSAARGVIVCGTGIGIAMAANRHGGVRAAVCHDTTTARLARAHNDANVLALGARVVGSEVARDCLKTFLATKFEAGRHTQRVRKLG